MSDSALVGLKQRLRESPLAGPLYHAAARSWHGAIIGLHRLLRGRYHDAKHFDRLFAGSSDPWRYEGDSISEDRRELLLQLVSRAPCPRLLEIGCGAGWMTQRLAPCTKSLLAVDISRCALQHARKRCAKLAHVEFAQFDLLKDELSGSFDAIVCAGVLVYLPWHAQLRIRDRIVGLLAPGGRLVLEHMCDAGPGECAGSRIHDLYLQRPDLTPLARERRSGGYEALLLILSRTT